MKYLGINPEKIKIGVFDFTSCEGCELQLANKERTLIDFLSHLEIVNFREVSSYRGDDYDIALIEGSISRNDEVERLKIIRANAKVLVAMGSCACFGGINNIKNEFLIEDVVKEVYGDLAVETSEVRRISDVVAVDLEIPGCPVSKSEIENVVVRDGDLVEAKWEVVETPRFFEVMLCGKPHDMAPTLTSRICGICSVGHTLASLRAIERAMRIDVPDDA